MGDQRSFLYMDELLVDNFAGGGGASYALEQAYGRPVDIAINHDPEAIAMHTANHAETTHFIEDVWAVDPRKVTDGRPVGLAWFSPDCKHHSKAKGGKPREKRIRGLAWIVLKWAGLVKPRVIFLENVEEFEDWGPLTRSQRPCKKRKGLTFQKWKEQLEALGYVVDHKELRACDYGAPTIRKRLFLVARRDGLPIVWPEPTHGPVNAPAVIKGKLKPQRTAADIIDWSIPCPSIFERTRPLAENTLRRIAKGIEKYVIESGDPFIVPIAHYNGSTPAHDIREPVRTVTANPKGGAFALAVPTLIQTGYGEKKGQAPRVPGLEKPLGTVVAGGGKHALVSAFLAQHNTGVIGRAADVPLSTITTSGSHQQLVTAHIQRQFGNSVGHAADQPAGTVTAGGGGKSSLVTSSLIKLRGSCAHGQDAREPMPTITAGGLHVGEVRAFLMKYYGTGGQWQDCRDPMHTVTAKARLGLVLVHGDWFQIVDIGMRMLSPRELYLAQGFPPEYIIDLDYNGKRLTKTAQVRMCGNSVSPSPAIALIKANLEVRVSKRRVA